MNKYPNLFSPIRIGNEVFRNRLFAAPTAMIWSPENGSPDETYAYYYEDKARGGAASVTVSETCVSAKYAPRRPGSDIALNPSAYTHELRFVKLADAISRHGAIPSIQLFHSGEQSAPIWIGGRNPVGPSGHVREDGVVVEEMTRELINETVGDFADAAAFVKHAGFRMVMLHGAHGWLLSQFLSSATNKRTDEYGGSLINRARFPIEVIKAVRCAVGSGFPIEYRISGDEHMDGGMKIDEVAEFCRMIDGMVDIIHVSAGSYYTTKQYTFPSIYVPHGCNLDLAAAVKKVVNCPVATVGAHSDPAEADRIIAEGLADIVYMGRQIVADPETPNKARLGLTDEIIPCTRCLNCIGNFGKGKRECDVNPVAGNELWTLRSVRPVVSPKRVLIAGGGPGGLQAAITARKRGHIVILADKSVALGGALRFADRDAWKCDLRRFKDTLAHMAVKLGVDVRLNTEVTPALVEKLAPDALIVAIGGSTLRPDIPGIGLPNVTDGPGVYDKPEKIGDNVLIIGGGLVGCETGLHLAKQGKKVTILEMADSLARDSNHIHMAALFETMEHYGVLSHTGMKCAGISEKGVLAVSSYGAERFFPADTVVVAAGIAPNSGEAMELRRCDVPYIRVIGDCERAAKVKDAVHAGYFAALDIV